MTVSRHRRRVSTTQALVASLVGVGVALVLGVAGALAIYHTKDGQLQGRDTPEVQFPPTPTGAMAVLDERGSLASLAVVTVRPDPDGDDVGTGGTVVPVPVSADVSGGLGEERLPLDETVSLFGVETISDELPALLGLSVDEVISVTESELASMLAPLGELDVTLPRPVTTEDGTVVAAAGSQVIDGAVAAAVLAARDPATAGAEDYEIDVAVWKAIGQAVGSGLQSPLSIANDPAGGTFDDALGRITSGPLFVQTLQFEPIVDVGANPRGVDALALDRAQVALTFAHLAPSRVAAPHPGYTFRVVVPYSDEQLSDDFARLDVAYTAVRALHGLDANVRSVDTSAGDARAETIVEVANPELVAAAERLDALFGPIDVRVAETRIAGIDMVLTLGTDYLATLDPAPLDTSDAHPIGSTDAGLGGSTVATEQAESPGEGSATVEGTS